MTPCETGTNIIDLNEYYAGGYFLLKSRTKLCIPRAELPANCDPYSPAKWITWSIPNTWGFTWATDDRELSSVAKYLRLSRERLLQMQQWVTSYEAIQVGYPNVFLSYTAMHTFASQFIDDKEALRYIGIGIHRLFIDEFLHTRKPVGSEGTSGIYQMLSGKHVLHPDGYILGFDILHFEYSEFNSWLCPYLYSGFVAATGIALNAYGLLDDEATAVQAAKFSIQAEYDTDSPILNSEWWLPWIVVDYTHTRNEMVNNAVEYPTK